MTERRATLTKRQQEILEAPIVALGISIRVVNALEAATGVALVKELLRLTPAQIKAVPNIGDKTLADIYEALANFGFIKGSRPIDQLAQHQPNAPRLAEPEDLGLPEEVTVATIDYNSPLCELLGLRPPVY